MSSSPRQVAARAYKKASGRHIDAGDLKRSAAGTYDDTGEKWVEFYIPTRTGWYVRVTNQCGVWVAQDVIDSHGKEIAR